MFSDRCLSEFEAEAKWHLFETLARLTESGERRRLLRTTSLLLTGSLDMESSVYEQHGPLPAPGSPRRPGTEASKLAVDPIALDIVRVAIGRM